MPSRKISRHDWGQGGYLLLPVVVGLVLIASIALLLNHESAVNAGISGRDAEMDLLRQVTEAGWQHANWKAQGKDCAGYGAIPSESFAGHTYSAIITPGAGSPVTIAATGTLANTNSLTVTRSQVKVYESKQTAVLQPDASGKDSFIESESGHTGHNKGNHDELWTSSEAIKEYRTLLQFDLSSVPTNVKILAATLEIELSSLGETAVVEAHRLLGDWTELGVTWDKFDGTNAWTTPGGDFASAASGFFLADSVGVKSMEITELAQVWVEGSQPNFGLILLSPSGGGPANKYHSSDKIDEYHPKLTIDYVCECGVICMAGSSSGLPLILSTEGAATLGGLSFTDKDLAEYDPVGDTATLYLDGASVGNTQDIDAVHVLANDRIVLSTINTTTLGGLTFENEDLVEYDPVGDIAILRFDGSAFFSNGNTDISAVHVMDDGKLLLTNENTVTLGGLSFDPNDVVMYDPVADIATMYLDGGTVGLTGWINAVHLLENGHLVLSTDASATIGGLSFTPDDLVEYDPVADSAVLYFDGGLFSASENVRSVHIGDGSGPHTLCEADYAPDTRVGDFPTGGYGQGHATGVTYIPEGTVVNGITTPAGGAWITVDSSSQKFLMVDMSGAELDFTLSAPSNGLSGVTFITSGAFAGYLAVVQETGKLYFVDPADGSVDSTIDISSFSQEPFGITFIEQSASGDHEGELAIVDDNQLRIYYVNQTGTTLGSVAFLDKMEDASGVAHLPGTDKLLVVDKNGYRAVFVNFAGIPLRSYNLAEFAMPGEGPDAVAINPETCDHVIGSRGTGPLFDDAEFMYLNKLGGGDACAGSVRDRFDDIAYNNQNGSLDWATNWAEIGEGTNPANGDVRVINDQSNFQLRVKDNDRGIGREADLSGFASATLSFDYRRFALDNANDFISVELSNNGGGSWTEIDRLEGPATDDTYQTISYDISAYISTDTRLRFVTSPTLGNGDIVYYDNIGICLDD